MLYKVTNEYYGVVLVIAFDKEDAVNQVRRKYPDERGSKFNTSILEVEQLCADLVHGWVSEEL